MGRPKLGETALRRHVVTVRLNDGEHEELRRQAGKARLRVPEFIRQRVLERRLQIGSPRQLGVAEFRELNRIGVNLNQIARALNQRSMVVNRVSVEDGRAAKLGNSYLKLSRYIK